MAAPVPLGEAAAALAGSAEGGGLDAAAFGAFYQRTAAALWAYLSRVSGDRALADDLTQEAYLRFLRAGFVGESEDHRRRYLFRVASNLLTDHRRRRREVATAPEDLPEGGPAGATPAGDGGMLRRDLSRLLLGLSPRHRQVVWLAHVEGASHREIAAALGVGEASVRLILFRARRRLAAELRRRGYRPGEPRREESR